MGKVSDMTITNKINVLFICVTLLLGGIATGYTAYREYQINLDHVVEGSLARVLSRPELQVHIYRQDKDGLQRVLDDFLQPHNIVLAIAINSQGETLARREQPESVVAALPSFATLREGFSTVGAGLSAFDSAQQPTGIGLWSSLVESGSPIHLTMPVFSSVNPTRRDLTEVDFFTGMTIPATQNSLVVIGYIQLAIARAGLLADISPAVRRVFFGSLALTLLLGAALIMTTRRITRPLSQLSRLADQIASGEIHNPVEIEGGKEFKDIAHVLNAVMGGVSSHTNEINVDHKLLSWKVDEKASQLSERNEELDKATAEISETRSQLHQMSYYDSLTSLPNRRLFTEQLSLLLRLAQREGKPLALLFLNLDNFKRINDSLGHSAGDLLLREVGKRLTGCLRDSDMLAHYVDTGTRIDVSRLGGDEFTVVLNQLDSIDSAGLVARRIIDKLVEPMLIDEQEVVVTPSVGIAVSPADAVDVEGLLKAAGTAMHHAKDSTRDDFLFYNKEMNATGLDHLKLEADLRKAIEREQLVLHYQPQVDTSNGGIVGAEALLRWEHPEFGQVPPFKFVPLAEEIGLIDALGDWVLVEACRQMAEFRQQGVELPRVAINVSTFQFGAAFTHRVKEVLQEADLPASMLELGLSEGILVENDRGTSKALQELQEMGVYLSVDNFGTSYSPLNYISRQPLDELKIDRSFILDCDKREASARLVSAIIAMARSLDLRMVAEGVETENQYQFLSDNGARVMQGYLFSEPVPAAELKQLLVVPWHFMTQIQRIALASATTTAHAQ